MFSDFYNLFVRYLIVIVEFFFIVFWSDAVLVLYLLQGLARVDFLRIAALLVDVRRNRFAGLSLQ
jgi:hypothetical protein